MLPPLPGYVISLGYAIIALVTVPLSYVALDGNIVFQIIGASACGGEGGGIIVFQIIGASACGEGRGRHHRLSDHRCTKDGRPSPPTPTHESFPSSCRAGMALLTFCVFIWVVQFSVLGLQVRWTMGRWSPVHLGVASTR